MENCSTVFPVLPETRNDYISCLILHMTSKTFTISSLEEAKCTFRRPLLIVLLSFHIKRLYAPEEIKTLKVAFVLTKVSLNPSSLSRTSPLHALSKLVWSRKSALLNALYSVSILLIENDMMAPNCGRDETCRLLLPIHGDRP